MASSAFMSGATQTGHYAITAPVRAGYGKRSSATSAEKAEAKRALETHLHIPNGAAEYEVHRSNGLTHKAAIGTVVQNHRGLLETRFGRSSNASPTSNQGDFNFSGAAGSVRAMQSEARQAKARGYNATSRHLDAAAAHTQRGDHVTALNHLVAARDALTKRKGYQPPTTAPRSEQSPMSQLASRIMEHYSANSTKPRPKNSAYVAARDRGLRHDQALKATLDTSGFRQTNPGESPNPLQRRFTQTSSAPSTPSQASESHPAPSRFKQNTGLGGSETPKFAQGIQAGSHRALLDARRAARAKYPPGHPERLKAERAVRQSRKAGGNAQAQAEYRKARGGK